MHLDLSPDWLNVVFNTVCKNGSWMPIFSVSAYLIRFSVTCSIGKYPCLLGALLSQNWVFLVPPEAPLTFIFHKDAPWLAQLMALRGQLHNFCEYIIQIPSDTENWRRELKSRLTLLSFKKRVLRARTTTTHTLVPSFLSSISITFFFCCFVVFFSPSLLFYFLIPVLFISAILMLLHGFNVVSFKQWLYFFLFFHQCCLLLLFLSWLLCLIISLISFFFSWF